MAKEPNSHDKVRKKLFVCSRPQEWRSPLVHVRKNPSRARGFLLASPYYLLKGEGRSAERVSANPASLLSVAAPAATHESPVRAVYVTLKNVLGVVVLGVPEPSKSPTHGSLIVLFLTVLLIPLAIDPGPGHSSSI